MDFSLSNDQIALQETVRKFASRELHGIATDIEKTGMSPRPETIKKFSELGLLGINLPAIHGGHGLSHLDAVIVLEEGAKVSPAVACPMCEAGGGGAGRGRVSRCPKRVTEGFLPKLNFDIS